MIKELYGREIRFGVGRRKQHGWNNNIRIHCGFSPLFGSTTMLPTGGITLSLCIIFCLLFGGYFISVNFRDFSQKSFLYYRTRNRFPNSYVFGIHGKNNLRQWGFETCDLWILSVLGSRLANSTKVEPTRSSILDSLLWEFLILQYLI